MPNPKLKKEKNLFLSLIFVTFFISFVAFSFVRNASSIDLKDDEIQAILRMTEVLGAVYYLDSLCGMESAINWREDMDSVLDSYKFSKKIRQKMIGSFNSSFNDYKTTYKNCNKRTKSVARTFYNEGAILAQKIAISK